MSKEPIVITGYARTPLGGLGGTLKDFTAPQLGSLAIKAAIQRAELPFEHINEIFMGCVLPAGQGQAPARQAALGAGLPNSVTCTTLNKMCGSGMKSVMLAYDCLSTGQQQIFIAGGMESMTNAPYLLPKARMGYRMGHAPIYDHMFLDGLEDAYDAGRLMGEFAEDCASTYHFSRQQQDAFAIESLLRAQQATQNGNFAKEIVAITVTTGQNETIISQDEQPNKAKLEKIPLLKPAFNKNGTITAANSSSISDGAAALVVMPLSLAKQYKTQPLARIVGHASHAQAPALFTTAPIFAIQKLLERTGWKLDDVDLFEVNEAFAVVAMAAMHDLSIPHEKINVHGGACALGHPIGASGARILVTLINALRIYKLKRGIAAICIGGGEATAMAVELL